MKLLRNFSLLLVVVSLAPASVHAQWYVTRYLGNGGDNNPANVEARMSQGAPAFSAQYNLFDLTDPENQGSPSNFSLNHPIPGNTAGDDDNYAVNASGVLNVTTAGNYIFRSSADDGSRIMLYGRSILNDNNCCSNVNSATIALAPGRYAINYTYAEGGGGSHGELAVSNDGGATFNLLGRGADGAFTAAPGLFVDQSGPTRTAPLTSTSALAVTPGANGLRGEYFQAAHNNQNRDVDTFFAGNPSPAATFVSSSGFYNTGGTNISGHLGADAASLSAPVGGNSTDNSTFRFTGFLEVRASDDFDLTQPGIQVNFRIDSDDNSRLTIGGLVIEENDGGHGFGHFSTDNIDALLSGTGDNTPGTQTLTFLDPGFYALDAFYHNGNGGLGLAMYSSIGAGGPTFPLQLIPGNRLYQSLTLQELPEPATLGLWSLLGAGVFLGTGLVRRRCRVG